MPARRRKSRKRSNGRRRRRLPPVFLDEALQSQKLAGALRQAGFSVRLHKDYFTSGTPDSTWLREVGRKNWLVVTRDQRIRKRRFERLSVDQASVGLFVICGKQDLSAQGIVDLFTKAKGKMLKFLEKHKPPFIANITGAGQVTLAWESDLQPKLPG